MHSLRKVAASVIAANMAARGKQFDAPTFEKLVTCSVAARKELEALQHRSNVLSDEVRHAAPGDRKQKIAEAAEVSAKIRNIAVTVKERELETANFLRGLPNILHESVPYGTSEADNVEVFRYIPGGVATDGHGNPIVMHNKDHVEIGNELGLDLRVAAGMSGSRFMFMRGGLASVHRALAQFMLDTHVRDHGYTECYVPYIVNSLACQNTGQLPKFEADMFKVQRGGEGTAEGAEYLISTSEIPLTNSVSHEVFQEDQLPLRMVAHTPCFRSEAGSAGRDTYGLIRQHQFDKVEMVQICAPSQSYGILEEMVDHAGAILKALRLPYRVVELCSADVGFSSAKTYDLEVWVPSQATWREISSVSNCEAFQAGRMDTKVVINKKKEHVHTLNGSGVAVGRALVALLENHYVNGQFVAPAALAPYLGRIIR